MAGFNAKKLLLSVIQGSIVVGVAGLISAFVPTIFDLGFITVGTMISAGAGFIVSEMAIEPIKDMF